MLLLIDCKDLMLTNSSYLNERGLKKENVSVLSQLLCNCIHLHVNRSLFCIRFQIPILMGHNWIMVI